MRRRISAVSYLNTIPFIYGIEHAGADLHADLLLSPPSGSVAALCKHKADIALIPVAAIPSFNDIHIFSGLCLGAHDAVRTVVLAGNTPLKDITTIYLDSHSRTSAVLVKILAAELWDISPEWKKLTDYSLLDHPGKGDAFLLIGDKVFAYEGKFGYMLDLASEWKKLTGLPFVFAAWVAREDVDRKTLSDLDDALHYGVEHIGDAVGKSGYADKKEAYDYLTKNMDFIFDAQKRRAMELFWNKGMKADPLVNPG